MKDQDCEFGRVYKKEGMYMADGNIEYLERGETQAQINGNRIEFAEIESKLLNCNGVKRAIAKVEKLDNGESKLVCFVSPSIAANPEIIVNSLKGCLPSYMHPDEVIGLDEFPLTANGKIDSTMLKRSCYYTNIEQNDSKPNVKEVLIDIWKELLALEALDIEDDFFELGGNSFLILKLQVRISKRFDVDITAIELFSHKTISQITHLIEEKKGHNHASKRAHQNQLHFADSLPASYSLNKRWEFIYKEDRNNLIHRQTMFYGRKFQSPVSIDIMLDSLKTVCSENDVFRMRFEYKNSWLHHEFAPESVYNIEVLYDQSDEDVRYRIEEYTTKGFRLDKLEFPYRIFLISGDDGTVTVLLFIDHMVFDAWSVRLFENRLFDVYVALNSGEETSDSIFSSYSSYIKSESSFENNYCLNIYRDYFLKDKECIFPIEYISVGKADQLISRSEYAVVEKVRSISKMLAVSTSSVYLACYFVLLERLTSKSDISITMIFSNRVNSNAQNTMGNLLKFLPIRQDILSTHCALLIKNTFDLQCLSMENASCYHYLEKLNKIDLKYGSAENDGTFNFISSLDDDSINSHLATKSEILHGFPTPRYLQSISLQVNESTDVVTFRLMCNSGMLDYYSLTVRDVMVMYDEILAQLITDVDLGFSSNGFS